MDSVTELRREMESLIERVSQLEQAGRTEDTNVPSRNGNEDQLWALAALPSPLADHPSTADGTVMLAGLSRLPDREPVMRQQMADATRTLGTDWSEHATAFAALGHPIRLELLRHIVSGVHATAQLAQITSLGTTGQLHHHLRQLVAAGWVRQTGRGSYDVPTERNLPLLLLLVSGCHVLTITVVPKSTH
jgi:hypothetical protein